MRVLFLWVLGLLGFITWLRFHIGYNIGYWEGFVAGLMSAAQGEAISGLEDLIRGHFWEKGQQNALHALLQQGGLGEVWGWCVGRTAKIGGVVLFGYGLYKLWDHLNWPP